MRGEFGGHELLMVTGKGGVGKSAVAAALGRRLARRGRRVLVLEVDPRENIHQLFDAPPSGGEIRSLAPGLHLQNLRPGRVLDQLVREKLKIRALADRLLGSPMYEHFVGGAPGLEQMAILGHALRLVRGQAPGAPEVDLVLLDAPATGHGVSLLAAPLLVSEVIERGPIGRLTRDVADLVRDPRRTGVVVVTLAEEMPATEALELRRMLSERLDRRPDLLVVNALYPPLPADHAGDGRLDDLWRRRRRLNERELGRLADAWSEPRIELPLLPIRRGPALVEELAAELGRQLAGRAGRKRGGEGAA